MPKNPHADFSPVLKGYSGQSPFKFWCQMALPLTYDDSLSYYELLNKVVSYLNNTISDVANVEDNVGSLLNSFTQLQDYVNTYFDELDIEQELRNVLDAMALDGTLDEILSPLIATQLPGVVENQIDDVVASQIDNAVAGQIDDSVEDLLPAAVAGEVGEWLDENLEPTSPPVDPTLTIPNAAADAKVTGEEISGLKSEFDEITEPYGRNLINQEELLTIPGWEETDGVYSGTLRNIADAKIATTNGGFTAYAPFKPNTRYTLGMKVRCTGAATTGNGLRINFNYIDSPQITYYIENSTAEELNFTCNPAAAERTLDFISFGVNSGYDNVWYIRELYLTEYSNEHEYTPFKISAIDLKAREDISGLNGDILDLSAEIESGLSDGVEPYYNFRDGYYDLHGSSVDISNPEGNENYRCIVITCEENDRFIPLVYAYGAVSRRWGFIDENGNILSVEPQISGSTSVINDGTIITAPAHTSYLVCNHRIYNYGGDTLTFKPVVYKLSKYDAINDLSTETGMLPKFTKGWKSKIIGIWDKYVAIYENNTIKISTDFGDNFDYSINVANIGTIKHCRFYTDGTLAVFTTNKAYYSKNYTSLTQASLYNADGSAFSSDTEYNFDVAGEPKTRKIIDGVDMCVFGNYTLSDATTREMIWYSVDGGESYKIAYEFNIEGHYKARHTHMVYYYEPEDTFIVLTGDKLADQCRVLGFTYNAQNDTWTVVSLSGEQSSRNYKWSYIDTWDGYLYYAHDVAPGSIKRCKYADIGDISKHEIVLDEIPNDVCVAAIGPAGDMIVIQSIYRSLGGGTSEATLSAAECARKIYYSSDRKSFAEIVIPPITFNRLYTIPFWYQPVQNHLISGTWWDAQDSKLPSHYIDDIVRASGFPKAFLPL